MRDSWAKHRIHPIVQTSKVNVDSKKKMGKGGKVKEENLFLNLKFLAEG